MVTATVACLKCERVKRGDALFCFAHPLIKPVTHEAFLRGARLMADRPFGLDVERAELLRGTRYPPKP